jgi:tetratricopeptide (TPR) repeat protein
VQLFAGASAAPVLSGYRQTGGRALKKAIGIAACLAMLAGSGHAQGTDFIGQIDAHYRTGRIDSAIVVCRAFVAAYPDSIDSHGVLGKLSAESGDGEKAQEAFQEVIDRFPERPDGYMSLANLYAQAGRPDVALRVLDDGLQKNAGQPVLLLQRGTFYSEMGNQERAIGDFRALLEVDPTSIDGFHNLAIALAKLEEYDEALAVLVRGREAHRDSPMLLVSRGGVYHAMGKTTEAFDAYREAVSVAPEDPQVHRAMGFMAAEIDSADQALAAWHKTLSLDPGDLEVRVSLGQLYLGLGSFDKALEQYQAGIRTAPREAPLYFAVGQIQQHMGRIDSAKVSFKRCIVLDSGSTEPYKALALTFMASQSLDSARIVYERVIEIDSTDASVHNNLGYIHAINNDYTRSREAYRKAIAYSPDAETMKDAQANLQIVDSILAGKMRARHILVNSEEKALDLLARLRAGEEFGELARQYSTDKTSAQDGGNLGFFGQGDMHPEFEEAVLKLKVGEFSEVVKTPIGYHIILRVN